MPTNITIATLLGACLVAADPPASKERAWPGRKPAAAAARAADGARQLPDMLGVLRKTRLSVVFRETPANDALRHLQHLTGVTIIGRYKTERVGHGIDPATPITLAVDQLPAMDILERILAQCSVEEPCTWQLRHGYVEVGTKRRLSALLVIRLYPVDDLLVKVPVFDNAPKMDVARALDQRGGAGGAGGPGGAGGGPGGAGRGGGGGEIFEPPGDPPVMPPPQEVAERLIGVIKESVEPEVWQPAGRATIRHHAGTLVVRAPGFVHRALEEKGK